MADVTVIGGGTAVYAAGAVLGRAGFDVRRSASLEDSGYEPVILGDVPTAFSLANEVIAAGRHLLIASPQTLPVNRFDLLFAGRRRAQAVYIWSERRHHPGYKFVHGSIEADVTWTPRFIRVESLSTAAATTGLLRWLSLESLALIESLSGASPVTVSAHAAADPRRGAIDFLRIAVTYDKLAASVQVGLGEAVERRESLIAAGSRKAFVNELDQSIPLRLIDGGVSPGANQTRWITCPTASPDELARQQCLAFLEATHDVSLAREEALLWQQALSVLAGVERSLLNGGSSAGVRFADPEPRFRLLTNPSFTMGQAPIPA
jgi:hypothetical protein